MNRFLEKLSDFGFVRLGHQLSSPIVVNCVPGAGKTTLIRELLAVDDSFVAYSTVKADEINLTGRRIEKFKGEVPADKLVLLDEYQNLSELPPGLFAIFGDPLQNKDPLILQANFVSFESRRFGSNTAQLLTSIGYRVESSLIDKVNIGDIFTEEPKGQIVCFERDVIELLKSHSADFLTLCEVQGRTFEVVTFVTSGDITESNRHAHLICLSRHSKELLILSPDAKYPSI